MEEKFWYVYIILTEKDRLYTGISTDTNRRFLEHSGEKAGGAKFFRSDKPKKIVYVEAFRNRSEASVQESAIKKMTRLQKENFIKESSDGRDKIHSTRKVQSNNLEGSPRASSKRK